MDLPDEVPFSVACEFLQPDDFDLRVVDQAEVWVDANAAVHRLDTAFPLDYALNLLGWLESRARPLHLRALYRNALDCYAAGDLGLEPPQLMDLDVDAMVWIRGTPLYRRLAELADKAAR